MAKMTEAEAFGLLESAIRVTALIPTLLANWQAIKDGLSSNNPGELNAKIAEAHEAVQTLDGQLQALDLDD